VNIAYFSLNRLFTLPLPTRLLIAGAFVLLVLQPLYASADAWLNNDPSAIWNKLPGVYKEGNQWLVIFHAAPGDSDVKIYGDFTRGQSGAVPLTRTPDGNFWWLKGADSTFSRPPVHGDHYRFQLRRGGQLRTFQDPATRWVSDTNIDTGMSKVYLSDEFQWTSQHWQRPTADKLNIYQLHSLRFGDRNNTTPFLEIAEELDGDGSNDYINELGVTAIRLLPVNEFIGQFSWGYNPDYFYAVENTYGGPDQLKQLVDTAHREGIAVILDLEFNHLSTDGDNILWAVDNVTYADGDTRWGPLCNFNNDVAKRGRDGKGWEMNQLSAAGTILAREIPMVFMGQEAAKPLTSAARASPPTARWC